MTIKQLKKLIKHLDPKMEVMVLEEDVCYPACNGDSGIAEISFDGITETCLLLAPCHHPENSKESKIEKLKLN